jgi:hypothetical protein
MAGSRRFQTSAFRGATYACDNADNISSAPDGLDRFADF